jgi:hypothetical protein
MRSRTTLALTALLLAGAGTSCAISKYPRVNKTPVARSDEDRNCVTTKVTGSRLPRRICEGEALDPTLIDNRRSTERRSIEH